MTSHEPSKPTILAFHGSGSNGMIHTVQLARLLRLLKPTFNIISMEGPFPSAAGPGVLPFFEGCGPFKRWVPPNEWVSKEGAIAGTASGRMFPEVEALIVSQIKQIRGEGGRVVGLIGFSQGTRVVAGLLKGTEIRRALGGEGKGDEADWLNFDFAISVCGSYPPPLLPAAAADIVAKAGQAEHPILKSKIALPTMHVQGKNDEWEWAGKLIIDNCYALGDDKSVVIEADMGHHYPVVPVESEQIQTWAVQTWRRLEHERLGYTGGS